jgi:hypothetical protein
VHGLDGFNLVFSELKIITIFKFLNSLNCILAMFCLYCNLIGLVEINHNLYDRAPGFVFREKYFYLV